MVSRELAMLKSFSPLDSLKHYDYSTNENDFGFIWIMFLGNMPS
jgi:hypothetical protein